MSWISGGCRGRRGRPRVGCHGGSETSQRSESRRTPGGFAARTAASARFCDEEASRLPAIRPTLGRGARWRRPRSAGTPSGSGEPPRRRGGVSSRRPRSRAGSPAHKSPKSTMPQRLPCSVRTLAGCRSPCSQTGGPAHPGAATASSPDRLDLVRVRNQPPLDCCCERASDAFRNLAQRSSSTASLRRPGGGRPVQGRQEGGQGISCR